MKNNIPFKKCLICPKVFYKIPKYSYKQWNKKRFCSIRCARKGVVPKINPITDKNRKLKISKTLMGHTVSNKVRNKIGMTHKLNEKNKGKHNSPHTEFKKGQIAPMKGKRRIDIKSDKNWNWKGGITILNNKIRTCFEYRQWRSDIFTRDDFTCQECGKKGGYLEAHHLKEFSKILEENNIKTLEEALNCEELWNINNGITLCSHCHNKTKKYNHDN